MVPDLDKREKLAGVLGDDALEFQFQQQSKHDLRSQAGFCY